MARTPLYKAAEAEMIRRIETGAWAVGRRLPNEFELAEEFGVSQGTMRRALITLEGMGLLNRKPGRGTLVAAQSPTTPAASRSGRLVDTAGAPVAFTLHRARASTRAADPDEAALLGDQRLATLSRLLKLDGERVALDEITVPEALVPALSEDARIPLDDCLADHGLALATISDAIGADITDMSESVTLTCDRHTPLLILDRTARDGDGQPMARQRLRIIATRVRYLA